MRLLKSQASERHSHVVFCLVKPTLDSDVTDGRVHIFFDESLSLDSDLAQIKGIPFGEFLEEEDYEDARKLVNARWDELLKLKKSKALSYYAYIYFNHAFPIVFWRLAIERIISKYNPDTVSVYYSLIANAAPRLEGWLVEHLDQHFLHWQLKELILSRFSELVDIRIYPVNESLSDAQECKRSYLLPHSVEFTINKLLTLIEEGGYLLRNYRNSLRRLVRRRDYKENPIAVIGQYGKFKGLLHGLASKGLFVRKATYEELWEMLDASSLRNRDDFRFDISTSDYSEDLLKITEDWICFTCTNHDQHIHVLVERFFAIFSSPLITDGEHDPLIHRLINQIELRDGWLAYMMPEGSAGIFLQKRGNSVSVTNASLVRAFNSALDLKAFNSRERKCVRSYVCGYGTSLRMSNIASLFGKVYLCLLGRKWRKTVIFYNLPHLYQGLSPLHRPLNLSLSRKYLDVADFLDSIDESKYTVIASTRGSVNAEHIPGSEKITFSHLHWSILAQIANICVFSDSSIGPEIINMGKPVIKWRPRTTSDDPYWYLDELENYGIYARASTGEVLNDRMAELLRIRLDKNYPRTCISTQCLAQPNYSKLIDDVLSNSAMRY